ncbi:MAG: hypothetical protein DMD35_03345 [Gemmatimonadetes bacterium]|nr:MAG: hypothetical protein DMD35_03345 [Gemmatimonadota bacterium]
MLNHSMPAASVAGSSHVWLKTGYVPTTASVARHATRAVANRHRPRVITNERDAALGVRSSYRADATAAASDA